MDPDLNNEIVVETKNLKKVYKDFWGRTKVVAVENLNITVKRGEIFALIGPNGSGKTTTIKILLGLLFPTSGTVSIFKNPPSSPLIRPLIGYMPEETHLYPYLTAKETLLFFGGLSGLSMEDSLKRAEELLKLVKVTHAANRPISECSKGMARRIYFAQAIINDPHLLILDEPTSGLDPEGRRMVKEILLEYKKNNKTVIICSHLLSEIESICDRILILDNGKVKAYGTLSELLEKKDSFCIKIKGDERTVTEAALALEKMLGIKVSIERERFDLETVFLHITNREKQ